MEIFSVRGKRLDTGEWVRGSGALVNVISCAYYIQIAVLEEIKHMSDGARELICHAFQVDPNTISRYTGIIDSHCKEIWEGDLVSIPYIDPTGKITNEENCRCVVVYQNGGWDLKYYSGEPIHEDVPLSKYRKIAEGPYISNYGNTTIISNQVILTVCGNIHDKAEFKQEEPKESAVFSVYTDGACSNNQDRENSIGGWAYVVIGDSSNIIKQGSGREIKTTNNRMEMLSVIKALEFLSNSLWISKPTVNLYSDSQYVVDTINLNWKKKMNQDLWQKMDVAIEQFERAGGGISWHKVKGHNGNKWNELVDSLAVQQTKKI